MIAELPFTDVSAIAGVLGLFFLLVAFYKSIFHRRRKPTDALSDNGLAPKTNANQPIRVNDPFQKLEADTLTAEAKVEPDPEPTTHVTAFRQFTPHKKSGTEPVQTDALYVWE